MLSRHPGLPGAPISGYIILNRQFHTTGARMEEVRGGNMGEVRGSRKGRKGSGRLRVKEKQVWDEGLEAKGETQWSDVEPITTQILQR